MKNKKKKDRLPDFDWAEHLDSTFFMEDDPMYEGNTRDNPWGKVGKRARRLFEMLLPKLGLELSKDDIDDLMDPADFELDLGGLYDDDGLLERVREHMAMVLDYWDVIFEDRPAIAVEERRALVTRLNGFNIIHGRLISDEEYDAYMDGLEE